MSRSRFCKNSDALAKEFVKAHQADKKCLLRRVLAEFLLYQLN